MQELSATCIQCQKGTATACVPAGFIELSQLESAKWAPDTVLRQCQEVALQGWGQGVHASGRVPGAPERQEGQAHPQEGRIDIPALGDVFAARTDFDAIVVIGEHVAVAVGGGVLAFFCADRCQGRGYRLVQVLKPLLQHVGRQLRLLLVQQGQRALVHGGTCWPKQPCGSRHW